MPERPCLKAHRTDVHWKHTGFSFVPRPGANSLPCASVSLGHSLPVLHRDCVVPLVTKRLPVRSSGLVEKVGRGGEEKGCCQAGECALRDPLNKGSHAVPCMETRKPGPLLGRAGPPVGRGQGRTPSPASCVQKLGDERSPHL